MKTTYRKDNPMSYRQPISSDDPDALQKLTEKLDACKDRQAYMKEINAYFRRYGTCRGFPDMPDVTAAKLDVKVAGAYSWNKRPFFDYELSNNNAEIRRLESRIKEITDMREVGFAGWEFEGGRAEINTDNNRLQLIFDDKPDEGTRAKLKRNGFKWAPSQGAWQRQLTDAAIGAAGRLDFLKPTDGRTVREHQPKAPARDDRAR
jgi:hypothetical protein